MIRMKLLVRSVQCCVEVSLDLWETSRGGCKILQMKVLTSDKLISVILRKHL